MRIPSVNLQSQAFVAQQTGAESEASAPKSRRASMAIASIRASVGDAPAGGRIARCAQEDRIQAARCTHTLAIHDQSSD
jgi:hypothetical protein